MQRKHSNTYIYIYISPKKKKEEKHSYIYIYISCNPASDKMNENIDLPKQTKNKRKKGLMAIIYRKLWLICNVYL